MAQDTDTFKPLSGPEILVRELAIDRPTAAGITALVPVVDRPAGLQLLAAGTVAEIRRLTGAAAFPYSHAAVNAALSTFLLAR